MMISTKGRYALRVMVDLTQNGGGANFVSLKSVSERQEISQKYLEMIVSQLSRGGVLRSMRGKEGGYALARPADRISVGEVVRLTEGSLAPVSCLECGEPTCEKAADCLTLPIWSELDKMVNTYLDSISIQDVVDRNIRTGGNYLA